MKKTMLITLPIMLLFGAGLIVFLDVTMYDRVVAGSFELSEYQWAVETFPYDRNVGIVENPKTAIEHAKELWIERFSPVNGKPYRLANSRKIMVLFDSENECWLISGTLPSYWDGGVPNAIIQKDGKVLAVWHTQ